MSPLQPLLFCLLLVGLCSSAPNPSPDNDITIEPRPQDVIDIEIPDFTDVDFPDGIHPNDDGDKYVGYCGEYSVMMWPGNSRKFWSWGYVYLKEPYPANCTLKYTFTARSDPSDTFAKYGYKVTGTFTGPNIVYSTCTETDYVAINDTEGQTEIYCGLNATIDFLTGSDYFEFYFISQEDSPGALGFYVTIESYYLCGGLISSDTHGPTGYITSPLHSTEYPANSNCAWWFTSLDETTIKMDCSSFLLEDQITFSNGTSYCTDYLSISYEALSPSNTSYFCNSDMDTLSKTIYSAGNTLLVAFRSDSANHYSGFNCTYDFILYSA